MSKAQSKTEYFHDGKEHRRTTRPNQLTSDFIWNNRIFHYIGRASIDMTETLSMLPPSQQESFKKAALNFAEKGSYAPLAIIDALTAIGASMKRSQTGAFNKAWVFKSANIPIFKTKLGAIKSFLCLWKKYDPKAISDETLDFLIKTIVRRRSSSNILSDDPEKSWLTDEEYEALLVNVWRNYEDGIFSTSHTLMTLLTMQYSRRPVQLSQLKIKDFRVASLGDASGLSGTVVSFPGAKDVEAETGFRDGKIEHHPLPDHLWTLYEIQRNEIRSLFERQLNTKISDSEISELPLFTDKRRIKKAVSDLSEHYRVNWRSNISHQLFHLKPHSVSRILAWKPSGRQNINPPLSHRTGKPLVVNATRLRHTRARQLARKGVPQHVLSLWMGHSNEKSLKSYYNDPAEDARKLEERMAPALMPLAMAFAGNLIDNEDQASRWNDPTSRLEFASDDKLKNVGNCGKYSYCATTSVPVPCYRCRHFEPLIMAPHEEVLEALKARQVEENQALRIGGARNYLIPIDLSADILAVQNCIDRCNARKTELGVA